MGLSNIVPNSRLAQPGVCTSTTRPATPFEGMVIFETDTNRVLVYDASAWVMIADTDQPPGMQLVKTQTVGTAVSSQVVSDAFSMDYDSYKVVISNVGMSSTAGTTVMWLRMHDGTNPASSNYNYGIAQVDMANNAVSGVGAQGGTNGMFLGTATGDKYGTSFDVINPNLATHTLFMGLTKVQVSGGYSGAGGGMHQTSTAYTGFDIRPSTGTLTGGTIRVYGYRN